MWNPSNQKFVNIEEDEAGRLKRFRKRFGRGYDAESMGDGEAVRTAYLMLGMAECCKLTFVMIGARRTRNVGS